MKQLSKSAVLANSIQLAGDALYEMRAAAFAARDSGAHKATEPGKNYFSEVPVESVKALLGEIANEKPIADALRIVFAASKWTSVHDRGIGQVIFATTALMAKLRPMLDMARDAARTEAKEVGARAQFARWIQNNSQEANEMRKRLDRSSQDVPDLSEMSVAEMEALHLQLLQKVLPGLRKEIEHGQKLELKVGIRPAIPRQPRQSR